MDVNPLPRLGYCPACSDEVRVRADGTLFKHSSPGWPCCPGSRRPVGLLEPTFVRWLHANAARKDAYTNRVTHLAQHKFRGCTRSPNRTPADMTWTTAEELHDELHRQQVRLTGSENRSGYGGTERCDWVCRDVTTASRIYAELAAA
ncbi:hypothetical protein OHA37_26855 [Streptomyces sp. NBC_00335]|uniref:hypothetical protein n=1 Tax=unclassified Streptomyces TaxID=2593676 RepID=UPI00224EAFBC|nr:MULTISPECIES: hypothetical protein [unclassified Streptomyces]MCX5407470.1 hypothetical protein [Streptomyces sp. NBC_00086]